MRLPIKKIVSLIGALLLVALPAFGKVLLEETFEKAGASGIPGIVVDHGTGKAWRSSIAGEDQTRSDLLRYPVQGHILPASGTIAFDLVVGNKTYTEALFGFTDEKGKSLLVAQIFWKGHLKVTGPVIKFEGWMRRDKVWYTDQTSAGNPKVKRLPEMVPLGKPVATGQKIHLAFTWGEKPEECNIYLDGQPLPVLKTVPFGLPDIIRKSSYIVFGGETIQGKAGAYGQINSHMADIRIHDVPVNALTAPLAVPIRSVTDDSFKVPGISGKLVAGDRVTATLLAAPGGKASFDMGKVPGIPMEEVAATSGGPGIPAVDNGTYRGSYTIRPGDDYEDGRIVGHFVSSDNVASDNVASASKWTIDTKPRVVFSIDRRDMPADSTTKARVKLVAKDANGNVVKGRHLKLTLATTDEYTGLVGAGDFGKDVGATVETRWRGETDSWGEVEFDYKAGFAAKTVILTAKDLDSGGVTVDYITAYKEASIDIALTPVLNRAAARRGTQYIVKVEASRTELTADGKSRSVIRATLLDPGGKPVSGDPMSFSLSSPNGTLRTIEGKTNASGVATAEYIAGKKIGIVVITATATFRNASGNVSIILLSDAPAKIYLKARPESLPADGFSRADLQVKVTDINDNPNKDTKVEFKVSRGGGKLDYPDRVTDRFGDAQNRYTSGTTPGVATVMATVRSKVPTEAELSKAKNVLFVPYSEEGDEIRVEKWLKKKGDAVAKGEPVVEYTVGRDRTVRAIAAPYDGTLGDIFVEYWDNAEVGQTLAHVLPLKK